MGYAIFDVRHRSGKGPLYDRQHLQDPIRLAPFRAASEKLTFSPNLGLPGQVLASKRPAWMASLPSNPEFSRSAVAGELQLSSGFAFPVFVGSEVVAVLEFFSERDEGLHLVIVLLALAPACMATTTWADPSAPGYGYRGGRVDSVQEIVQRTEGNPAGGALAGAVIGALLFGGRGPCALVGAAGGAAVGASASQGTSENRTYQVVVHFDDGTYGTFAYGG